MSSIIEIMHIQNTTCTQICFPVPIGRSHPIIGHHDHPFIADHRSYPARGFTCCFTSRVELTTHPPELTTHLAELATHLVELTTHLTELTTHPPELTTHLLELTTPKVDYSPSGSVSSDFKC